MFKGRACLCLHKSSIYCKLVTEQGHYFSLFEFVQLPTFTLNLLQ